jgi:hypothetical protein
LTIPWAAFLRWAVLVSAMALPLPVRPPTIAVGRRTPVPMAVNIMTDWSVPQVSSTPRCWTRRGSE